MKQLVIVTLYGVQPLPQGKKRVRETVSPGVGCDGPVNKLPR